MNIGPNRHFLAVIHMEVIDTC